MLLVFDLDGVLVDSRLANLEAYRSVGVEPPENFYETRWESWCTRSNHEKKVQVFSRYTLLIQKLPLLDLAVSTRSMVLTMACRSSVDQLRSTIPELENLEIRSGMTAQDKIRALRVAGNSGVYFDDSEKMCSVVKCTTDWTVCHVGGR